MVIIEHWKIIKNYNNYAISDYGNVKNVKTGRILKTTIFDNKYKFATLYKDGKNKKIKVARLVAQTFIPNPNNLPCINHKDENKLNDNVENLEWCTYSYNINYGTANQRRSKTQGKKVCKIDKNTNIILNIYDSTSDAANDNDCYPGNISSCCLHKYGFKSCGGYKWEYYDNLNVKELINYEGRL